jgi:hypothetical protein
VALLTKFRPHCAHHCSELRLKRGLIRLGCQPTPHKTSGHGGGRNLITALHFVESPRPQGLAGSPPDFNPIPNQTVPPPDRFFKVGSKPISCKDSFTHFPNGLPATGSCISELHPSEGSGCGRRSSYLPPPERNINPTRRGYLPAKLHFSCSCAAVIGLRGSFSVCCWWAAGLEGMSVDGFRIPTLALSWRCNFLVQKSRRTRHELRLTRRTRAKAFVQWEWRG